MKFFIYRKENWEEWYLKWDEINEIKWISKYKILDVDEKAFYVVISTVNNYIKCILDK